MIENVFIGIIMIKPLAKNALSALILTLLSGWSAASCCAEVDFSSSRTHQYSSYEEFASSVCLPCHYRNIPDGTDLQTLLSNTSEQELKNFLLPRLKYGNMPPDEVYRQILYNKFLQIK